MYKSGKQCVARVVFKSVCLLSAAWLSACAYLSDHDKGVDLSFSETGDKPLAKTPATFQLTVVSYFFQGKPAFSQWLACEPAKASKSKFSGTVILLHTDRKGFVEQGFCDGWMAQGFLAQGLNVIALNRPGYGGSTGKADFSGPQSMVAMEAALKDAQAHFKSSPYVGVWAYETGIVAAAGLARRMSGNSPLGSLRFMILGGGVYDYDETLKKTQDEYLRKDIAAIKATGGNKALEDRSIAYDVSGLSKQIFIYHGQLDTVVPVQQAKAFSDALTSSEYKVSFQQLDGVGHNIPAQRHAQILGALAAAAMTPEAKK